MRISDWSSDVCSSDLTADPVSVGFPEPALEYGGGHNIVSVILLDIRTWDTMGEISVLVAAATGVASLLFLDTRLSGIRREREIPYPESVEKLPSSPGRRTSIGSDSCRERVLPYR